MRFISCMKSKKWLAIVLAAVVIAAVTGAVLLSRPGASGLSGENLLLNGDFSQVDAENFPLNWYADAYAGLMGSQFEVVQEEDGPAAHIVNHTLKDARFAQVVSVSPGTYYRLHGYIRASASGGLGANLSVEGVAVYSETVYDSQGEWQEVTLYGVTGEDQRTVTVFVRLGGYSGEAFGEAYFRDVTLTRVDSVPLGSYAYNWYAAPAANYSAENTAGGSSNASVLLTVCGALYLMLFIFLCRFLRKLDEAALKEAPAWKSYAPLAAILLLGLGLRLFLAASISGYDVDIGCFTGWANGLAQSGPVGFYQYLEAEGRWSCDYPPGYLWILWLIGWIGRLAGTGATEMMVKLPPILADLCLCVILFKICEKRLSRPASLAAAALYAFNPLILVTGSAWGQADALMTLLLVLVVVFALKDQWKAALPLYMLAVLFKPQALMFGPLGLTALILHIVRRARDPEQRRRVIRELLTGLALSLGTALIVALPFALSQSPGFLLELYAKTMGQYAYASVNCCNVYFLLGKNWAFLDSSLSAAWWIPALAYLLATLPLLLSALTHAPLGRGQWGDCQDQLRLCILGGLAALLGFSLLLLGAAGGLTYASLGTAMIVYAVAVFCALYVLGHDPANLPIFGAGLLLLLCSTGTMMHERYAFPAVALLLLGYALKKDVRVLWLAVGVSISGFLNVGCVLDRNIRIGGFEGSLDAPTQRIASDMSILEYFSAGLNCLLSCCSLALCSILSRAGTEVAFAPETRRRSPLPRETALPRMTCRDYLIMGVVTVLYAGLAFTNLGSMKAPQTAFTASVAPREIVMDLGDSRELQLSYYVGYHRADSEVRIETSEDGQTWLSACTERFTKDEYYFWAIPKETETSQTPKVFAGRFVRFTSDQETLSSFDAAFASPEDNSVIAASRVMDAVQDEQIVLDLGEKKTFHLAYYGGIHDYDSTFTVEISDDGEAWNVYYTAPMNIGDCFKWQYLAYYSGGAPLNLTGRYLRVTAPRTGLTLFEMLCRDAETGETLPVTLLSDSLGNETSAFLIDEQDTLEGEPGWYNSTYFDEIYHARTAYEHLHGMQPYECSHPPLGKVLMSWCVAIFGMTPFGWRFAGALAGVLMLPGMYLLGKLLIRKKWGGAAAMALLALDLMHFTQTRIATIDSFVVLFIIWMIYFMLRWFYQDFFRMKFWKTLIPLALSGICMGLAVASKWTGCYAGVALAILFFLGVWRRYRLIRKAKRMTWNRVRVSRRNRRVYRPASSARPMPASRRRPWQFTAARHGARRLLITVASCLIFFVLVPAGIYYLSYVPYFAYDGGVTVQKIINAANYMLWYHSQPGLGMDHPYYTPWYQWPVIYKPMFYFSTMYEPAGYQSAINALGNPAVWWLGLAGLLGVCVLAVRRHLQKDRTLSAYAERDDSRYAALLICFFVQYLPWVLVPRGTYIYHYFPCVPIIILCGLMCLDRLAERRAKAARNAAIAWIALAAILFIVFFPFASGALTPQAWMDEVMKWFPRIYY